MSNDTRVQAHMALVDDLTDNHAFMDNWTYQKARAAVEASARQLVEQAAPGFVMVPVEPTEAMISAGFKHVYYPTMENDMEHVWDAMLAARPLTAAPIPEASGGGDPGSTAEAAMFTEWAGLKGYDTAHTYDTERSRWVFLNPMTAELWSAWQSARAQKGKA